MLAQLRRFAANRSVDSSIARAIALSGGLAVGAKVVAFAKEMLVAATFGIAGQLDAYLIALMLVGIPHGIVVNAVQWKLLPGFVRADADNGRAAANAMLRQTVAVTLVLLLVVIVCCWGVVPSIIPHLSKSAGPDGVSAIRQCFLILCVYYFASGVLMLGYAVLQAQKRFLVNGTVPYVTPATIAVLILVSRTPTAETLAIGMALGFVIELAIVQQVLLSSGLTLMPSKPSRGLLGTPHLAAVGKLSAATIALSLTPLVEQAAAAELGVGAVSTLGYASKLTALVSNLGVAAVGVAVFPYFSELLARGQIAQCWSTLRRYALAVVGAGCVLTLGLIALSDPIVRLLFMRGAFDELAAGAVSVAQQAYLLQIPGALLLALCSRLLLANGNAREVAIVSVGQLVLFAVLVVIGLQAWRSPAVIALAYSIAGSACAAVALLLSREALKRAEERAA